ncbi:hypothetical protein N431DRAFT_548747 [Stipitochalara longipes BDJ]|nr:hypothetical protein N431DRAFT_548747 [Stipitochalara longipes BDJ]
MTTICSLAFLWEAYLLPSLDALTPANIKAQIIARLSSTDPREIMMTYFETIHKWFWIFSQSTLTMQHPTTWDTASVDFSLLCFAIILLNSAPQESQGAYILSFEHRSMYLKSKAWISLLEGAGLNSIDFVKARLVVNIFEVSHGLYPAAYLSIAATIRAADALALFHQEGGSQSLAETDPSEYRIMWCGIAVIDRYIATENSKCVPITRDRPMPPATLSCNPLCLLEQPATAFTRLFEASTFLDHVHRVVHQPVSQETLNVEEMTVIVRTLKSFEAVVNQEILEQSKLFSICLALSSTALLLTFDNGSKTKASDENWSDSLNKLIEDIVEMVELLNGDNLPAEEPTIPPLATFLIYKAAAIITRKLQADVELEVNLQRLRTLRKTLKIIAQRWLAGQRYLNLLDEDTTPRVLNAVRG